MGANTMSGFKLPVFPHDLVLRSAPKTVPKPRERSKTESGIETPSLLKPSSFKKLGGKKEGGASLLSELLDFYDEVHKETERLLQTVQDEATAKKAKEALARSKIPPGLRARNKMTAETFRVKAETVLTLMQRLELKQPATLRPPPTKLKQKRQDNKDGVGRLSQAQRQLNIQSTIMAGQLQRYDLPSASSGETVLGEGYAIPLCLPNDMEWNRLTRKCSRVEGAKRTLLVLNQQAVDILRSISGPVCVVAIVGPCRSGKSYILSRLITSEGGKCHFDLGHEFDPKTMGIWMWDQPFKFKLKNGEEVTMVLLDTEGIDAANATEQGDSQIFTLSVLLSSLLIYNSMSVPRREDLNQMHYIANLSKSIQVQTGKSAVGDEGVQLADCNPRFMWLLRDVILEPTDRNGKPCHVKDYLLQKVLVEDTTGDEAQKSIRRCLLSFFSAFDSETLPPPSTDPHIMRNIENPLYQQDISPMFLQKAEYVRKRILNNCSAKRGFTGGSVVSGFQIAELARLYVEALNSPEGVPVVGSTWQRVLEATYTDGMEKAVMSYGNSMEKEMKTLPIENEQLLEHHQRAVDESLKSFQHAATLDSESELYQTYLEKVMTKLADYSPDGNCTGGLLARYLQVNYNKSQSSCQVLLHGLREEHLSPLVSHLTPETDFQTIEKAFTSMLSVYNEQSIGPAADDVLQMFLEEQEKERELLEDRLTTIKNYDAEATKRMKELRESQLLIDKKEREMIDLEQKILQSRKDHEAMLKAMKNKASQDADKLRKESTQRLEEQERRLTNMADANLQNVRTQNEAQLNTLRAQLRDKESQLQIQNARIQQEMERQRAETEQLRQQASRKKKGSCFAAGTIVTRTDGSELAIEKQMPGIKVLAIGGEATTITDEYVEHNQEAGQQLFGINDDNPFAALHHPFWTTDGWKCLDPELAKEENPSTDFKLLQVGDIVFRIAQTDPLLYEPVKIHRFTFTTLSESIKIYGLHLDGPRSYHANGYIVAANYPVLTKRRVEEGMKKLSQEEKDRLKLAVTSAQRELSKVLGSWAKSAFQDMGLVHEEKLTDD